jgi:hypothetical protein
MPDRIAFRIALAIAAALASGAVLAAERYDFGRVGTLEEIKGWDIDISPDGAGLPPGRGDVRHGEAIFDAKCASCHGARGEGKPMDQLVGGPCTLRDKKPEKTVGSFWPYATTLFDFVRRAMPLNAPQSLAPTKSTPFRLMCCSSTGSFRKTRLSTQTISPRSRCRTATVS